MAFPVDEAVISAVEKQLGRRFPASHRERLMKNNGGEIRAADDIWQLHPVFDRSDRKRIARTANRILRETASAQEWTGFPESAIAIAANGTGNLRVLMPDDDGVHRWSHETGTVEPVEVLW